MKVRLLLLEDDQRDAELTLSVLGESGLLVEADHVSTEDSFRTAILSRDYDVILADYTLPDFDGLRALDLAQGVTPATPFLFVSGTMGEDIAIDALRLGASDYIFKTQLDKLVPSVVRAVREKDNFNRRIHSEHELERISEAMRHNQKMVTIGRMSATIAHETNNPLESVTNLLFLLRDEVETEEGKRYLATAEHELKRVIDITRQTLQFYRESDRPVSVACDKVLDEVLRLYRRKLTMKNVSLRREIGECPPLLALPGELRQVMSNLIGNAIDATQRGGAIRVRLKESRSWGPQRQSGLHLLVADDGCGISQQSLRRIGDAFYTTKGQDGTGLGMWVTRGILKKYNGRLHIYSSTREGRQGTVMSVFIPYLPLDESSLGTGATERSSTAKRSV